MSLTEKQKSNIQKLSVEDCIESLDLHKKRLGLVSQSEYKKIMCWNKSREQLVNDIKSRKIKSWKIDRIRYLIINDR